MSLKITHIWTCDLCGHQEIKNYGGVNPSMWSMLVTGTKFTDTGELKTLICPKHAITATVNGDVVTVKGVEA